MLLRFCFLIMCILSASICLADSQNESITEDFIISKLKPRYGASRSVSVEPSANDTTQQPGDDVRLAVDLYVSFAFGSANLTADGEHLLEVVAGALNDSQLGSVRFEIGGHTDAVGSDTFNQRLSERRAQAVRLFLVRYGKVDGNRLVAKGYGKSRLKDTSFPESSVNRRVEVSTINP